MRGGRGSGCAVWGRGSFRMSSLKDYLKKYESSGGGADGNEKKKRKRKNKDKDLKPKLSNLVGGVLIVDEDPTWHKPIILEEREENHSSDEDAVVVEEDIEVKRMRRLEAIQSRKPYFSVSEDGSGWISVSSNAGKQENLGNTDLSPPRKYRERHSDPPSPYHDGQIHSDSFPSRSGVEEDLSPPRRGQRRSPNLSPPQRGQRRSPDLSPPRRGQRRSPDLSPPRRGQRRISNLSPPRGQRRSPDLSPSRRGQRRSPDLSPPRRGQRRSPNLSPTQRGQRRSPDLSPPRRGQRRSPNLSPPQRGQHRSPDLSPPRRGQRRSPDLSPPRRGQRRSPDLSPPRRGQRRSPDLSPSLTGQCRSSDLSQPRRRRSPDLSPLRKHSQEHFDKQRRQHNLLDSQISHSTNKENDLSLPRKKDNSLVHRSYPESPSKIDKQLSRGLSLSKPSKANPSSTEIDRKGGLFSRGEIKEVIDKKKADDVSRLLALDPVKSGKGAEPVFRVKGKRVSKEEKLKLEKKDEKPKEVKLEWGKGLAQKREAEAREKEVELEKEKPFARTRDDPELDNMLKERIRWGDPMAHLVKKKHSELPLEDFGADEKMKESGFLIPQSIPNHSWLKRGVDPPPNRFNIKPGRHWDGVDRSTGYEKESFKRQNEKTATQNEAYLWSVSEM